MYYPCWQEADVMIGDLWRLLQHKHTDSSSSWVRSWDKWLQLWSLSDQPAGCRYSPHRPLGGTSFKISPLSQMNQDPFQKGQVMRAGFSQHPGVLPPSRGGKALVRTERTLELEEYIINAHHRFLLVPSFLSAFQNRRAALSSHIPLNLSRKPVEPFCKCCRESQQLFSELLRKRAKASFFHLPLKMCLISRSAPSVLESSFSGSHVVLLAWAQNKWAPKETPTEPWTFSLRTKESREAAEALGGQGGCWGCSAGRLYTSLCDLG